MTAIELKTSINEDLNLLGVEALEYVSQYVRRFIDTNILIDFLTARLSFE